MAGIVLRAGVNNDAYITVNGVDVLRIAPDGTITVVGQLSALGGLNLSGVLDVAGVFNVNGLLQAKQGIKFPATQVASADPNTLDDYEEGSWTPVSNSTALTTANGSYVKIGGQCFITGFLQFPSSPGNSVAPLLTGLPFPPTGIGCIAIGYTNVAPGNLTSILVSGPTMNFYRYAGYTSFDLMSNGQVYFSGSYPCA